MNEKTLKLGRTNLKELAEWFGITYDTMRKSKTKKLEILKEYADFHYEGKKIIIDNIKIPIYIKPKEIVKADFLSIWNKNGLDTCRHVAKKIYNKHPNIQSFVSLKTIESYTAKIKIEFFGTNDGEKKGILGTSEYCWCKPVYDSYEPLTSAEEKILEQIFKENKTQINDKLFRLKVRTQDKIFETEDFSNFILETGCDKFGNRLGFIPEIVTKIKYY